VKDRAKERKETKEFAKEFSKELAKERKDMKDRFETKSPKEVFERPGGGLPGGAGAQADELGQAVAGLEARVAAIEAAMAPGGEAVPFIGSELRPDLVGGPSYTGAEDLQHRMAAGDRDAKLAFDTLP
jgi:immune inhibitor A